LSAARLVLYSHATACVRIAIAIIPVELRGCALTTRSLTHAQETEEYIDCPTTTEKREVDDHSSFSKKDFQSN
jgi:hypothetical protein